MQSINQKMPIVYKEDTADYSIGIWQSTETFEELLQIEPLNQADLDKWTLFQSDKRKREWLTVRVLLSKLFPDQKLPIITYDGQGKPSLDISTAISISHTKEYIAIIITSKASAGIDLEGIRESITVLAPKFINEEEEQSLPVENRIEHLHVLWGAKEVLYKLYGRGELDFRANLHVEVFSYNNKGTIIARIKKDELHIKHHINYELWQNMMLAHSVSD